MLGRMFGLKPMEMLFIVAVAIAIGVIYVMVRMSRGDRDS